VNASAPQVLIVDDNEDAAMSLTLLFELEDIVAASVPDAEAALRFVQQSVPPLLLIDIGLPGMNGFELARRLRALPALRASTLIALSGRDAGPQAQAETGFDQFWTKPFDPKKLLAEVQLVLNRR
jgi:CheY-like chemotaxis protein